MDSTKTDGNEINYKMGIIEGEKGTKSEDKETKMEKGNDGLLHTTESVTDSKTASKEGATQGDKDEGRRGESESCYDTTESELRSEQANARKRKTSITQRIKGMLKKGDAKAKEKKDKEKDKSEAGDSEVRKGLSFRYRRGKSKGRKEDSAVSGKAEGEDESAANGKNSAGKESQQDKQGKEATQQHKSGSDKRNKGSADEQEESSSASNRQRAGLRDTKSAKPPHKPGGGAADESAPEPSTPSSTRSPASFLREQESPASSYVTAESTLRRSSRKPRLTRTKRLEAFPSSCDPGSPRSPAPSESRSPPDTFSRSPPQREVRSPTDRGSRGFADSKEEEDEEEDETTRLLNRVLRAIQILEKERPELVEEAKEEEARRSPDHPRTLARTKASTHLPSPF